MGMKSRRKGANGERELSSLIESLTGWRVKRRVRQHEGDSDLEGVPGWSVEAKRHATATRGQIAEWWNQAALQAKLENAVPVLFYRKDRDEWRAVFPIAPLIGAQHVDMWHDYAWTIEGSVAAWSAIAAEIQPKEKS